MGVAVGAAAVGVEDAADASAIVAAPDVFHDRVERVIVFVNTSASTEGDIVEAAARDARFVARNTPRAIVVGVLVGAGAVVVAVVAALSSNPALVAAALSHPYLE